MKIGEIWRERYRKQNQIEILGIQNDLIEVHCLITQAEAKFYREEFVRLFEKDWGQP